MTDNPSNIGHLFSMSRDPVICAQNGTIVYMNPPATLLFCGDETGKSLHSLLPESILSVESDTFIASAVIHGKNVTVSCSSYQDYRLYSFIIPTITEEKTGNRAISVSLRDLTNTIKVSSDQILQLSAHYQDEKLTKYAAILKHCTCKMKRLLLNYTQLNAMWEGSQVFSPVMTSVNDLCAEIVDAVTDLAKEHGIAIDFAADTDVIAAIDVALFQRLLLSLICNSLQHCAPGSSIHVSLKANEKFLAITVADNGSGIDPVLLPDLFHQYDTPLDPKSGSYSAGQGLSVADGIAKLHDGSIVVSSSPGHGCTVAAHLKRTTNHQLTSPRKDYRVSLTDTIMTELSAWLTWEDFAKPLD